MKQIVYYCQPGPYRHWAPRWRLTKKAPKTRKICWKFDWMSQISCCLDKKISSVAISWGTCPLCPLRSLRPWFVDDALLHTVPNVNQMLLQNRQRLAPSPDKHGPASYPTPCQQGWARGCWETKILEQRKTEPLAAVTRPSHRSRGPVGALPRWKVKSLESARVSGSISCFSSTSQ